MKLPKLSKMWFALNFVWFMAIVSIIINFSILFAPIENTLLWLRVYQTCLSVFYLVCIVWMVAFLYRNRKQNRETEKRDLPRPLVVAAIILTFTSVFGYGYFIGIHIAFHDVRQLLKYTYPFENYLDIFSYVCRILFCLVVLYYIMQRKRFKHSKSNFHEGLKKCLEVALVLSTVFIITYKAYPYYEQVCKRLMKDYKQQLCLIRNKKSDENEDDDQSRRIGRSSDGIELAESQKMWATIHTGLLKPLVYILNQELYPILFILHWVASKGAHHDGPRLKGANTLRRKLEVKPIHKRMDHSIQFTGSSVAAIITAILAQVFIVAYFVNTINFTNVHKPRCFGNSGQTEKGMVIVINLSSLLTNIVAYYSLKKILAGHGVLARIIPSGQGTRVVHAHEDLIILAGCAACATLKLITDIIGNPSFEKSDCLLWDGIGDAISRLLMMASVWSQLLVLYKMLMLENSELTKLGFFGPVLSVCALMWNVYSFIYLFLVQVTLHLVLENPNDEYKDEFTKLSLVMTLVSQLVYPFSYLYHFTASTCWLDLFERFSIIGTFTLGKKCALDEEPDVGKSIKTVVESMQPDLFPDDDWEGTPKRSVNAMTSFDSDYGIDINSNGGVGNQAFTNKTTEMAEISVDGIHLEHQDTVRTDNTHSTELSPSAVETTETGEKDEKKNGGMTLLRRMVSANDAEEDDVVDATVVVVNAHDRSTSVEF